MSTLRISNIEAKSVPASATIDEKVKITNSSGDVLVFLDGKTSGITTVGINTTDGNITFDANSNVVVTGIITATKFVGTIEPTNLTVGGDLTISDKIIHSGDTNTAIRFPSADTISVETDSTERLRISSNGLVNIGAGSSVSGLSPLLHLHKNASSSTAYLHITNNTTGITNNDGFLLGINGVGDCLVFNKDSTPIRFATQGIERLRIASDGKIGIGGITSPAVLTHIYDSTSTSTATEQFRISGGNRSADTFETGFRFFTESPSANGNRHVRFTSNGNSGLIIQPYETSTGNAAVDRNIILCPSGGNVVIGHTSANAKLHLASGTSTAVGDATNPALQIGAAANYRFGAYTTSEGAIIANKNGDDGIIFHTKTGNSGSFGEACRITSAGNLKFPNGKGIDFSATVNGSGFSQELLDDYEEGNFNGADVSGGGLTLSYSNTGRYVKVGRQVYVTFDITYPSNGDGANISRVSTPYQAHLAYGGGWVGWTDLGRPAQVHVSGTNVYFMDNNSTGTPKHLYNSELSGKRLIGGYMLMTNS